MTFSETAYAVVRCPVLALAFGFWRVHPAWRRPPLSIPVTLTRVCPGSPRCLVTAPQRQKLENLTYLFRIQYPNNTTRNDERIDLILLYCWRRALS